MSICATNCMLNEIEKPEAITEKNEKKNYIQI